MGLKDVKSPKAPRKPKRGVPGIQALLGPSSRSPKAYDYNPGSTPKPTTGGMSPAKILAYFNDGKKNGLTSTSYNETIKKGKKHGHSHAGSGASGSGSGYSATAGSAGSGSVGGAGAGSGMSYAGFGKPPGYNRKEARALVNADIQRQIRELLMSAQEQKGSMEYDVSKLNALLGRQTGDLNYIFNEAKDYMGAQGQKINTGFQNARNQSNELFNQFSQQNASQTDARRQAAMAEMQRLGIQQAGLGQFDADAQNLAGQANLSNANVNANLNTMQAGADTVGNLLGSMAEGSRASNLGRAQNQHGQSVADTRQMFAQYMQNVKGDIRNTKKNRFSMVNDLMQKLQEQRFNQWMALNQANFSNQLDTNQFNLGMGQFNAGNFWKQADLTQQAAENAAQVKYNQQLLNDVEGKGGPNTDYINKVYSLLGW